MTDKPCRHLDQIRPVMARTQGCEECLATGARWAELRMCLTCGHVGCCDSSPGKHATRHFRATHHALMRSAEPGAAWGWCYVDETKIAPAELGLGEAFHGG